MMYKCQDCGKRFFLLSSFTAHTDLHAQAKREARFDRAKQERLEVNKQRYLGSKASQTNTEDYNQTAMNNIALSPLYHAEISGSNSVHGAAHIQSDNCHIHANVESTSYSSQSDSYSSDSSCSSDSSSSSSSYD
ncbi:hypothetical protein [Acinetobacter seifertii]|uniref:hypothetical protein n=1 Tax=Acinetobacter seifertii TaxID=1530123 RepID=UPI0019051F29|nr:hypothetical protein [Acinetobacter seifertii]MBJ9425200.1 hypothetical protein [Acinetobacter seifertii]